MSNYLTDEYRNIIGTIHIMAGKEYVYDAKYSHIELGHYDPNKNKTFDSYGREVASGRQLEVLPYLPHRIVFPLNPKESRQFTYHTLRNRCSVGPDYWDDGMCKGCGKHRNTCVEQGLPNLCESCYRLLQLYSRTDSFDLERMSQRKPVDERTLRNIIQKLTQSADEVSRSIETATRAAVITALRGDSASGKAQLHADSGHKKKKKLKWYHWCILILILYFVVNFLLPFTVLIITYFISSMIN